LQGRASDAGPQTSSRRERTAELPCPFAVARTSDAFSGLAAVAMKALIYSHLFELPGTPECRRAALRSTFTMWLDHLRGPGGYRGDVLVFTNAVDLPARDVMVLPLRAVPDNSRHGFLNRVLMYEDVPVRDYDVALQMDLDILAVDDVAPLLPRDERLWAAPSDLRTLDRRHTWELLPRWRRGLHRATGWRLHELGVSACVVGSATSAWHRNFAAWAGVIREFGDRPMPRQADQSFLNLLWLRGTIPIARWSPQEICHREWHHAAAARLLHFPGARKDQMERFRRV
jgi:hypothetical protein